MVRADPLLRERAAAITRGRETLHGSCQVGMIRAMTVAGGPERDPWAAHRDRTRRAIIDAFLDLLVDEDPTAISMPAVARRANVSIRTLYRYVPTKDALLEAASTHLHADLLESLGREPGLDEMPEYLRELWTQLSANLPAVRIQFTNPTGREVRRRRLERRREALLHELRGLVPDDHLSETTDLVLAATSASMMLELVDRMGHAPKRAAELATRIVRLVVNDATRATPPATEPTDVRPDASDRHTSARHTSHHRRGSP